MINYITPKTIDEKFRLMKFIHDNSDSFIMNTFGYLWENRQWWDKFPIQTYTVGETVAGLHAFTVDTKNVDTIKTYYIITHPAFRGQGIAKKMLFDLFSEFRNTDKKYFVNSEENSEGVNFYKKIFKDRFTLKINEFGTVDYIFEAPIKQLYNDLSNNISIS